MMHRVASWRGDGKARWYLRGDALAFEQFALDVGAAVEGAVPVCIATTAFALAHVLDALEARGLRFALPAGSRIMETGGFKGRARAVERGQLYARAELAFGLPRCAIVAEYGMTELTSQYYDGVASRASSQIDSREKFAPPWLRTRVVGANGSTLPFGTVGALVHVDLANRASCIAVATEDLGAQFDRPREGVGLVLIGRERGANLRGCSLDAETLLPR